MPAIQNLALFRLAGPVGVPSPRSTTPSARIRASAIARRTSSRLGKQTQRPVMQRAGPLRYGGLRAPARCTTRPARGKCSKQGTPSQASRGPKKQGRSPYSDRASGFPRNVIARPDHGATSFLTGTNGACKWTNAKAPEVITPRPAFVQCVQHGVQDGTHINSTELCELPGVSHLPHFAGPMTFSPLSSLLLFFPQ